MANAPDRPVLRIVRESAKRSVPTHVAAAPTPATGTAISRPGPSTESQAFADEIERIDLRVPRSSALLARAGCYVIDQALDCHRQAVKHATPGTFYQDVSPGLKSAEATKAWLHGHLDSIRKALDVSKRITRPYARCKDLAQAAEAAGGELDRATAVAASVGLKLEDHAQNVFRAARYSLNTTPLWVHGIDVLGAG